jgi:hypothetical protein
MKGKFLERSKFKNPKTNKQYKESEMTIGSIIYLGTWRF